MPFPVEPQAEMRPGMIELRWGDPDPALIPVEQIGAAAGAALRAAGAAALNYGVNEGPLVLREVLAGRIARAEGHAPGLDEIVITGGNSGALNQLLALLARPGDVMLVEDPSYSLALRMARDQAVDLAGVPFDDQGMQVEALPGVLDADPQERPHATPPLHRAHLPQSDRCLPCGRPAAPPRGDSRRGEAPGR